MWKLKMLPIGGHHGAHSSLAISFEEASQGREQRKCVESATPSKPRSFPALERSFGIVKPDLTVVGIGAKAVLNCQSSSNVEGVKRQLMDGGLRICPR